MDFEELMIGNIVRHPGGWVGGIDAGDFSLINEDPDLDSIFKPIPLTEEWLLKFGFEKKPESEYTLDTYDLAGFNLWVKGEEILFNDAINIDHVHQLQNLYFALTREKLTI